MKSFDFKSLFNRDTDIKEQVIENIIEEGAEQDILEEIQENEEEQDVLQGEIPIEEIPETVQDDHSCIEPSSEAKAYSNLLKEIDMLREELTFSNKGVIKAVNDLKQELIEKTDLIGKQEEIIKKQSQTISKFQDDLLYKIQKPLIMELIEISDNINMILNDKDLDNQEDFSALKERVRSLYEWVNASLSNNSVKRYSLTSEFPDKMDRKRQEVIDIEYTNDPSKDATYYTERPGYIWSMPYLIINSDIQLKKALEEAPKSFEFIIRPEEIIKYKYQVNPDEN